MIERYFAYGANVHPGTLARRGIEPLRSSPARLDGHRLVFETPGIPVVEPAFANVAKDGGDHVWGVVYELTAKDLARLRSFEGAAYQEIGVEVSQGQEKIPARAFVTAARHREKRPSRRYLRLIAAGARHHALPEEWILRLEAHPSFYVPLLHEAWAAGFDLIDRGHRFLVSPSARRE